MKRKSPPLRKLPKMRSDRQTARFVSDADLSKFDLSSMQPLRFEFAPKEARVNMRLPGDLLEAVKAAAQRQGVPYQRFIRQALERALRG
ncbi:MAG: CopG family antitoxin [Steroidobacteraceae bacterium]|jgi:predicted DNA binding CopG/RHH family protein